MRKQNISVIVVLAIALIVGCFSPQALAVNLAKTSADSLRSTILSAPLTDYPVVISNDTRTSTVNFGSFGSTAMRGIDTLSVIKGNVSFYETGVGAHYYACSSYSNTYSEAFANIKLPTSFNNAGNSRNGYIALGIGGSVHGVDLGLMNDGTGWFPCYYDVGVQFGSFPSYKAPSTATNAIITVTIVHIDRGRFCVLSRVTQNRPLY